MGEGVSPSLSRNGSAIAVSVLFSGEHGFSGGLNLLVLGSGLEVSGKKNTHDGTAEVGSHLQTGRQGEASSDARDLEITAVANDDPMVDTVSGYVVNCIGFNAVNAESEAISSDLQGTAPPVFVPGRSEHGSRPKESIYGELPSTLYPHYGVPLPDATSTGASKWSSDRVAGGSPSVTDNNDVVDSLNFQVTAPKMGPVAAIAESVSAGDETTAAKCAALQHRIADNGDLLPAGQGNAGYGVVGANVASKAISEGLYSYFQGSGQPNSDLMKLFPRNR